MSNITAAFLGLGMAGADLRKTLEHYDGAHISLVTELLRYAPYIDQLLEAGAAVVGDYPGVAQYEVTEEFGKWFTEQTLNCLPRHEPEAAPCVLELLELTLDFFVCGDMNKHLENEICTALYAVPFTVER